MVFIHSSSGRNIRETSGAENETVNKTIFPEGRAMDRKSVWIDGRQVFILPWAKRNSTLSRRDDGVRQHTRKRRQGTARDLHASSQIALGGPEIPDIMGSE